MAQRQNCYSVVDTTTATDTSHGDIVGLCSGLWQAVSLARVRTASGRPSAIVHCSVLLSSTENNESVSASKDFYTLVETDHEGRPLKL